MSYKQRKRTPAEIAGTLPGHDWLLQNNHNGIYKKLSSGKYCFLSLINLSRLKKPWFHEDLLNIEGSRLFSSHHHTVWHKFFITTPKYSSNVIVRRGSGVRGMGNGQRPSAVHLWRHCFSPESCGAADQEIYTSEKSRTVFEHLLSPNYADEIHWRS